MKILRIMFAAVLFVVCVFIATANMHEVAIFLPRAPVQGWPFAAELRAPLFVVILTTLVAGVVITGLATLFEQVRLRAATRRARKEREKAMAALEPTAAARDAALQEQAKLREELRAVRAELEQARAQREDAVRAADGARIERDDALRAADALRVERDEVRATVEQLRAEAASAPALDSPNEDA
jgi:uncharacterized integral membrane protein